MTDTLDSLASLNKLCGLGLAKKGSNINFNIKTEPKNNTIYRVYKPIQIEATINKYMSLI